MDTEPELSIRGESLARALSKRIEGVPDLLQRSVLVREFCLIQEPEVVTEGLQALLGHTLRGHGRDAWTALAMALCRKEIPYSRLEEVYRQAIELGFPALRLVFIAGDGALRAATEGDFDRDDLLDGMTLGERKSKARTQEKNILDRLLFDPDPQVLRILLRNPRLAHADVLKLASKRPNRPGILVEIADVPRWLIRDQIRRALVLNPYAPARLGVTLMPLMTLQDLQALRGDGAVHAIIRETAGALLTLRGWRPPLLH